MLDSGQWKAVHFCDQILATAKFVATSVKITLCTLNSTQAVHLSMLGSVTLLLLCTWYTFAFALHSDILYLGMHISFGYAPFIWVCSFHLGMLFIWAYIELTFEQSAIVFVLNNVPRLL